jgi:hypothetical protein
MRPEALSFSKNSKLAYTGLAIPNVKIATLSNRMLFLEQPINVGLRSR